MSERFGERYRVYEFMVLSDHLILLTLYLVHLDMSDTAVVRKVGKDKVRASHAHHTTTHHFSKTKDY